MEVDWRFGYKMRRLSRRGGVVFVVLFPKGRGGEVGIGEMLCCYERCVCFDDVERWFEWKDTYLLLATCLVPILSTYVCFVIVVVLALVQGGWHFFPSMLLEFVLISLLLSLLSCYSLSSRMPTLCYRLVVQSSASCLPCSLPTLSRLPS